MWIFELLGILFVLIIAGSLIGATVEAIQEAREIKRCKAEREKIRIYGLEQQLKNSNERLETAIESLDIQKRIIKEAGMEVKVTHPKKQSYKLVKEKK